MSQLTTSRTSSATSHGPSTQEITQPKSTGNEQLSTKPSSSQSKPLPFQPKKVPGRSSKPIINWLQRKLAVTVRHNRRVPEGGLTMHTRPDGGVQKAQARVGPTGSRLPTRVASSPFPQPTLLTPPRNSKSEGSAAVIKRKTISLNGDDDGQIRSIHSDEEDDLDRSSYARESTWSPASNFEADEDASIRPLPPSGPPSPSPSVSASSYLSDPHTFRSMAASTKPTTLVSIDLTPNGVAHIAQVPATPASQVSRFQHHHVRNSSTGTSGGGIIGSGASITFSALPPSLQSSSRPSSLNNVRSGSLNSGTQQNAITTNAQMSVQAPLHTTHHPRNNPRPSSPPEDNASMLTLASSAFAIPGTRMGLASASGGTPSAMAGDSMSHFAESVLGDGEGDISSQLGDDDRLYVDGERDVDASLRALRPRSSRRGSWGSEASDWSAEVGSNGAGMSTGTPSRSLWTTHSGRTGGDGTTRRSEGESVENLDEHSKEHQTPLQGVDPLPTGDEESSEKGSSLSKAAEIVPRQENGDGLNESCEIISAALPAPGRENLLGAVANGNGLSAAKNPSPKN